MPALALAIGLLGACTTEATKRGDAITKSAATSFELMNTCVELAYASPAFAPARRRIPADISQATLEQETDPSIATDVEIVAMFQVHPQLQECRQKFLDTVSASNPSLIPIYTLVMTLGETSLIEVMQKRKSWGDHVHDAKRLQKSAAEDVAAEAKNIGDGLSNDPKAVQARKQDAEKSLAAYVKTQKAFMTMRRPVLIKCDRNGMAVDC